MKLKAKKRLFYWTLLDENNRLVAKIRNKRLIGSNKIVSDHTGRIMYTTKVENIEIDNSKQPHAGYKNYIIYENDKPIVSARLKFTPNPGEYQNRACSLLPREIDSMELDTPYGLWVVQKYDENILNIKMDDEHLGSIICNSSYKANKLISFKKYPKTFWAGIYALIHYMRCEEYLIIV